MLWTDNGTVSWTLQIIMGTFIVSFIGNSFVESTEAMPFLQFMSPSNRRKTVVIIYFSSIIAVLTLCEAMAAQAHACTSMYCSSA